MSNAVRHTQGGQITIQWRLYVPKDTDGVTLKEGEVPPPKIPVPAPMDGDVTWIEIFMYVLLSTRNFKLG